jgi:uncharacterized membrane protein (UPF0127 family)
VNNPICNVNVTLFALVAAASIALIAACSTSEVVPPAPTTIVLPSPGAFIVSADCGDLEYGYLGQSEVTVSLDELDLQVIVENASNPSERAQGLMCRKSIPAGTGMKFYYPGPKTTGFWMYNTYVPIDILHIDRSHNIVDKITMTPCLRDGLSDDDWQVKCATEANDYVPSGEWFTVLELPAGWLESNGISDADMDDVKVNWLTVAD